MEGRRASPGSIETDEPDGGMVDGLFEFSVGFERETEPEPGSTLIERSPAARRHGAGPLRAARVPLAI
jgi:hypothetical protein